MDNLTENSERVLLAVLAHPDDETFGMGGTLAIYARRGVQVHLVCATRGEVGAMDPEYMQGFSSVGEAREAELRCAAGHLRLAGVHFLGYRDSGMPGSPDNQHPRALAAAPQTEVATKVAGWMRRLRPQVVITFDPIGGYKHPDHIAIHKATVQAFSLAGDPALEDGSPPYQPAKLYYQTIPKGFMRAAVSVMRLLGRDPRKFGRNGDINLLELVEDGNFPSHAVIGYKEVYDEVSAATACHASQGGKTFNQGLLGWFRRIFGARDHFMRAIPAAEAGLHETDLFA